MKKLVSTLIVASSLAFSVAQAADAPKPAAAPPAAPAPAAAAPAAPAAPAASAPAAAPAEKAKVCVDVKDKEGKPVKDAKGNVKQHCKEMKKHEKLEGTKVPEKK